MTVYVLSDYTRRPTVRHRAYFGGQVAECHHLTVHSEDVHAHWWAECHPKAAPIDYAALPMCKRCEKASTP